MTATKISATATKANATCDNRDNSLKLSITLLNNVMKLPVTKSNSLFIYRTSFFSSSKIDTSKYYNIKYNK